MFGGGEQYFAEPENVDIETLTKLAAFCAKLRTMEKPSKKLLAELTQMGLDLGHTSVAQELVCGAVIRHIKMWQGKKQLCYWYLLDSLSKAHRATFGLQFGTALVDVAAENIPWEDADLREKYESLVQRWDTVFPHHVVEAVQQGRERRIWEVEHPDVVQAQRTAEEERWAKEEQAYEEDEDLDQFAQPCLRFMQGKCEWGAACPLLHPEGHEGTLPPEARMGDWRCDSCGTINRHWRRRCFTCPKEKPQFKKHSRSSEAALLCNRDESIMQVFSAQFGYDPFDEQQAVAFWKHRLSEYTADQWIEERRTAFRLRILGRPPRTAAESAVATRVNWKDAPTGMASSDGPARKERKLEVHVKLPTLPSMSPRDKVFYIANQIRSKGSQSDDFAGLLYLLCQTLPKACADPLFTRTPHDIAVSVLECIRSIYQSWNVAKHPRHPAIPFFLDLKKYIASLPLLPNEKEEVKGMIGVVTER